MKYSTPQDEIGLDRLYFYNLIKNPQALPPQGLDALTAEIIRRLVLGEQLAEVKSPFQLDPAKARVWDTILAETNQPTSAWPPVDPALAPAGRYTPPGRPEPQPFYGHMSQPVQSKSVCKRNKLIGLAVVVGLLLMAGLFSFGMFAAPSPMNMTAEAVPMPVGASIAMPDKPQPPTLSKIPGGSSAKVVIGKTVAVINLKEFIYPAIDDLAATLKLDRAELQAQFQAGMSFMALAKSLNVDPDTIKYILIESIDRQLEEGLQMGKYNDEQVVEAMNSTPAFVAQLISQGKQ